ncbi:MAG: YidC/Oxa1 family membrane protein insertase [Actinomycetota bacterium]
MAEFFGAIQHALGVALNAIYTAIPSYGVAIILLTVAVRAVLIPLTIKQIRSMTAMQTLAPEQKKIQQKYKQLQSKVQDRQELLQLRQKMNQEMMALYKEHGVNPAGGCLPLLAQMPAFIALYSVLRTSIVVVPLVAAPLAGGTIPKDAFGTQSLKSIICTPQTAPSVNGSEPALIDCPAKNGTQTFRLSGGFADAHKYPAQKVTVANASWITRCIPATDPTNAQQLTFQCYSALGTGHLPKSGKLFKAVTQDQAGFVGMHLACTAPQAASKTRITECTRKTSDGGGGHSIPYYVLIALVIASTYYQSRQMNQRVAAQGQVVPAQQQMMTRIMPVFFGIISLNFPAGLNLYFLATNLWTIGQQSLVYRQQDAKAASGGGPQKRKELASSEAKKSVVEEQPALPPPVKPQGSRKRRKRKKRR